MIGLDTNVLVRYITQDDAAQAARAGQIIDQLSETRPGYITVVVLAKMCWVLRRAYRAESVATLTVLEAGCDHTVTFDRKAAAAAGMRLL